MNAAPKSDWIVRVCVIIIAGILAYGTFLAAWHDVLGKIDTIAGKTDTIDRGVTELLALRAHRIFTIVPEERTIRASSNPRVFQIEIPPNAVTEPVGFEFNQRPVMPLPVSLDPDYDFSGWSVVFGPEGVEFVNPFKATVQLERDEDPDRMFLFYFSWDEMEWHNIPTDIEQDLLTGEYLLTFETKDVGLYALAVKAY